MAFLRSKRCLRGGENHFIFQKETHMRRSLLSVIAFLFLVGSAFGQNKISDNQLALEVEAMTVTNLSGQTIKIPGYKLLGDPKTLESSGFLIIQS